MSVQAAWRPQPTMRLLLPALILAALLVAACGGDSDTDTDPPQTTDPPQQATDPNDGPQPQPTDNFQPPDDIRDDPRLEVYDNELTTENQPHVASSTTVPYPDLIRGLPPYGGPHDPIPLSCGIFRQSPRFENVVHAMEHGAVAVWYSPDRLEPPQIAELEETIGEYINDGDYVILAPYGGLADAVVMTSWGARITLSGVETRTIDKFIDEFHDNAPEPVAAGGCLSAL